MATAPSHSPGFRAKRPEPAPRKERDFPADALPDLGVPPPPHNLPDDFLSHPDFPAPPALPRLEVEGGDPGPRDAPSHAPGDTLPDLFPPGADLPPFRTRASLRPRAGLGHSPRERSTRRGKPPGRRGFLGRLFGLR